MAKAQTNLVDLVRKFEQQAMDLVNKTQSQAQDLIKNAQKDLMKKANKNPQIKNLIKRVEQEQKKYEELFMDVQNRALNIYKDRAPKIIADVKKKIEGYRKQAEKLYKEATSSAPVKSKTVSKPKAKKSVKRAKAKTPVVEVSSESEN